jgi:predicted NBD/HSP70 family sugar kinase
MTLPAQTESRRRNLGSLLRLVHERGPMRQVEISDELALTRSTGISLVDELADLGLVIERHAERSRQRGRPSPLIAASDETVVVVAEVAADTARVDVVALGGKLVVGQDLDLSPARLGPTRTLRRIARAMTDLLVTGGTLRVVGAAVAVHGAVNEQRRIVFAPNLGWQGADVGALDVVLAAALPRQLVPPVIVGNDADMGAIGELRRGAARSLRDFLYLSAERGVGGGIVVNGELVHGGSGMAGEIGHMKIGGSTRKCACGQRGCWETEIGGDALQRRADGMATWLGRGLGLVIPVLQPRAVVVGGHLAAVASEGRLALDAAIQETCPPLLARGIDIIPSQLGKDAALIGAAEVAFEHLLSDPAAGRTS